MGGWLYTEVARASRGYKLLIGLVMSFCFTTLHIFYRVTATAAVGLVMQRSHLLGFRLTGLTHARQPRTLWLPGVSAHGRNFSWCE